MEFFNITNKSNKFYFTRLINGAEFTTTTFPTSSHEIESLEVVTIRINFGQVCFTEVNYLLKVRHNFSTFAIIVQTSSNTTGT